MFKQYLFVFQSSLLVCLLFLVLFFSLNPFLKHPLLQTQIIFLFFGVLLGGGCFLLFIFETPLSVQVQSCNKMFFKGPSFRKCQKLVCFGCLLCPFKCISMKTCLLWFQGHFKQQILKEGHFRQLGSGPI